ncbi:hypothetical protein GLAREA_06851 [Glarea lozoyensis ATCC 20868]|uniref:Uncharacterized protein n=1 Tax=Glarea lozoyensis (strain ATCC 20868 / MF5171) TaxID=1116229 RepID=S3E658_GLAL2|nr:uncharacterized protein GLAREA_06851 [Glarea lozoyensis ATCC 20868]EPE33838.1 hypothetical protein GLAREA_06851 [Glarea lozoyensis ATCC 20868]
MASNADRGNNSSEDKGQSKQDNPFIKFRQFADSHIGSLLQGIVGLPSAFSKNPGLNARWADFDEDLRRRDELQAQQQHLRDADSGDRNLGLGRDSKEQWARQREGPDIPPHGDEKRELESRITEDLPLYSPVYKSLFNRLAERGDSEPDWKPSNFISSLSRQSFLRPEYWPFKLRSDQDSTDMMKTIRYLAYNELNCEPMFRAEYSLLPYLLFSDYSPLKLSMESQTPSMPHLDTFDYCAAFEDLIKTASGQPQAPSWSHYSGVHRNFSGNPKSSQDGMSWIQKLYNIGLLQQKTSIELQERASWRSFPRPIWPQEDSREEANTEVEMYERFLNSLSSATGQSGMPVDDVFAAILKEGEALIRRLFQDLDSDETGRAIKENVSSIMKDVRQFREAFVTASTEATDKNETEPESRTKVQENTPSGTSKLVQDSSRVVSSSTTSEHHTNEDGSIETTVTVWKRFADGRESCTTTSHFEDPPATSAQESAAQNVSEPEDQKSKPGWFWN